MKRLSTNPDSVGYEDMLDKINEIIDWINMREKDD